MTRKLTILIVSSLLAVCFFTRQPELCIETGGVTYNLFEINGYIYSRRNLDTEKLIDERLFDYTFYDIDGDKDDEIIALTKTNADAWGKHVVFYDVKISSGKIIAEEIYREDFSKVLPWKIEACNLDNDNCADIFIGVEKYTVFYSNVIKRPFFYTWDGEKLNKKWLGSFFSSWRLKDIAFGDYFALGFDVAAVLEENEDGECRMSFYNFVCFGFENMKTENEYQNIKAISTVEQNNMDYLKLDFNGFKNSMKLNYIRRGK
jgi:hypothetical protein